MKRGLLLATLPFGFAGLCQAQSTDSVRSKYIERFPDYFYVWPVIKQRSMSIQVEQNSNPDHILIFRPNNSYSAGVGSTAALGERKELVSFEVLWGFKIPKFTTAAPRIIPGKYVELPAHNAGRGNVVYAVPE